MGKKFGTPDEAETRRNCLTAAAEYLVASFRTVANSL
jgi:hypothetical protein